MISDWDVDPLIIYYEALSFLSQVFSYPICYFPIKCFPFLIEYCLSSADLQSRREHSSPVKLLSLSRST